MKIQFSVTTLFFLASLLAASLSYAQPNTSDTTIIEELEAWTTREHQRLVKKYKADPDILIKRGLIANLKSRKIDLFGLATGIDKDTPLQYITVATNGPLAASLSVVSAKPSDIRSALEFIGVHPGRPIDLSNAHYPPKGERIFLTVQRQSLDDIEARGFDPVRAEQLVYDRIWQQSLPLLGFRFVGSSWLEESGTKQLRANIDGQVLSLYNTPSALFEVPYIVGQKEILSSLFPNPDRQFKPGQKLKLRIRPEHRGDKKRVYEATLKIRPGNLTSNGSDSNLSLLLQPSSRENTPIVGDFKQIFAYLDRKIRGGQEPYLKIEMSDRSTIEKIKITSKWIRGVLAKNQVNIEPPESHIYYGAFLPNENWRDPLKRNRTSQPVEIHLYLNSDTANFSGQIIHHIREPRSFFRLTQVSHKFLNLAELPIKIKQGAPWNTNGVLFFVDASLPYGDLRKVYELVRAELPFLYVFTQKTESPSNQ